MKRTVGTVEEFKNCLGVEDSIHDSYTLEVVRTHAELIEPHVRKVYSNERQYDWKKEVEDSWSCWQLWEIEADLLRETDCLEEAAVSLGLIKAGDWSYSEEKTEALTEQIIEHLDSMPVGEACIGYLKLEKDCYLMF